MLGLVAALIATLAYAQSDSLIVGAFSTTKPAAGLPAHWQPMGVSTAKTPTRFTLIEDAGITVLRVEQLH